MFQLIALLLLYLIPLCNSQACMNACSAGLSTCARISYPLYISNASDLSNEYLAEAFATDFIADSQFLYNPVVALTTKVPSNCARQLGNFICNVLHPGCNPSSDTPTRKDMCYTLTATCGKILQYLPDSVQSFFQCDNPLFFSNNNSTCTSVTSSENSCTPVAPPPPVLSYRGTCQIFNTSLAPVLASTCAPVISQNVYVPSSWPKILQYYEDYIAKTLTILKVVYPLTPLTCFQRLLTSYCATILPSCLSYTIPNTAITVGIPKLQCRSFCEETVNEVCHRFYEETTLPSMYKIDCSMGFSPGDLNIPLGGVNLTVPCRDSTFPDDAVANYTVVQVDICPNETGRNTQFEKNDGAPCTLKCPDGSYTDDEWKNLNQIISWGASLSLVLMCFLIASYLLQYERRKFPAVFHIFQFIATAMFSVGFLINGKNPEKDVWCFDEGTSATQSNNTACGVQGFFFIFFGISLTAWCFVIAGIMFYAIVFNRKVANLRRFTIAFHLFAWGGPLVFGIAALASKSIGYGPPLAWCFIHFDGFGYGTGGLSRDYPLFYIPEGLLFTPILFMFLATVSKIIYVRRLSIEGTRVAKSGTRTFRAQVRVLILSFVIFVLFFSIFEWRLQIEGRDENLLTVGINYAYCKVKKSIGIATNDICDDDKSPARIDYTHTAFESFMLSGVGILVFIGFGADVGIYLHWLSVS